MVGVAIFVLYLLFCSVNIQLAQEFEPKKHTESPDPYLIEAPYNHIPKLRYGIRARPAHLCNQQSDDLDAMIEQAVIFKALLHESEEFRTVVLTELTLFVSITKRILQNDIVAIYDLFGFQFSWSPWSEQLIRYSLIQ